MKQRRLILLVFSMMAVLFSGILATLYIVHQESASNSRVVKRELESKGNEVERDLAARLRIYEYRLRGMRGAIHMVGLADLNRTLITRYSKARNVQQEYPGARGFGFIRKVTQSDKDSFIINAKADGWPDFTIRQFEPHSDDLFVVQYIDPPGINHEAIGIDIASEARRKEAAISAMQSGNATLTAPITLINEIGEPLRSFLFLLPIYRTAETPDTIIHRTESVIGWSYAPLVMREVMASLNLSDRQLHLALFDVTDHSAIQPIFESEDTHPDPEHTNTYVVEREVYGRTWRFEVSAYSSLIESLEPVKTVNILIIGILASLMLTAMIGAFMLSRQRQHEVSAGQARLATIVENSSDAIIGEALDGTIITWNRAAEQMFGYTEAEVLGQPLAPLLVPSERLWEDHKLLEQVSRGERGSTMETQRTHKGGELIDVTITCSMIRESDGRILGVAKLMHDISDRKRAEQYLKDFNAKLELEVSERTAELSRVASLLQAVLNASSEVSIVATDIEGRVIIFNRGAELLLGYSASEMINVKTPHCFHLQHEIDQRLVELRAEYGNDIRDADVFYVKADREGAETRQWTYVRKDGSYVPVSLVVTAIQTADGKLIGHLGMAEDITERLRINAELHLAKSTAERANAAKSLFLANMSHEIRTPMNAVIGIAHLLENTQLDEHQKNLLGKLQIAGRTLLGIINDILDIAKIESGEMRIEKAPFNPRQLLSDIRELFAPQADAKGLNFVIRGVASLPFLVMGDSLRVNQILMNLIGNAIKFTAEGFVELNVAYDDHELLQLAVKDSGCGIDDVAIEKLFTPFTQADDSTTRKYGGTGLGLSVVRGLTEKMGGTVSVKSELGVGSEFKVILPLPLLESDVDVSVASHCLRVVVLGVAPEKHVLSSYCHALGWQVSLMPSLEALITYIKEKLAQGIGLPDILIIDRTLLGAQGSREYQNLQALQRAAIIPIIVIQSPQDADAPLAEIDGRLPLRILARPVTAITLFNQVNTCLLEHLKTTDKVMSATRLDTANIQWLNGLRLLLVDDSDLNLEVGSLLLTLQGAEVQLCSTGQEALDQLASHPDAIDAVLMDIQMPEMDGYEATRIIRHNMGITTLPIIALTAGALAEEKQRALAAGMNDFLSKPLDLSVLIRAVRKLIEQHQQRPIAVVAEDSDKPANSSWPSIAGLQLDGVAARFGNDFELFLSSLRRLFSEFSDWLDASQVDELSHEKTSELLSRLHKFRGMAGVIGASELCTSAADIEQNLKQGEAIEAQRQSLYELMVGFGALQLAAAEFIATQPQAPTASSENLEASQSALTQLLHALHAKDMAAIDLFPPAAQALESIGGKAWVDNLWGAVDDLRFQDAIRLLSEQGVIRQDD
ncbi:CHASE domain-containing protein [Cellvibrio sp. PSBB023]|uniref:CHASE domain-containing hybrid sensor histidine kinase/response regulator n=1 Tax=Cellvibrio sp. PSBB023 TaxID=1945512 RepID=UPI0009900DF9|nr:CHASE domain-containing protein [Cellvibrio sp. PSBB023]AQT60588.1 hybrid sensor histidine kinase/response regulator [Cellvibrio sp. PSBB023]